QAAYKVRHVRRDPRVWLCVFPDGFYGRWAQIEGTADILELPDAMDGLIAYYRDISGEHPDWDDYRAAMEREQRVLLRVSITKAGPNVSGYRRNVGRQHQNVGVGPLAAGVRTPAASVRTPAASVRT